MKKHTFIPAFALVFALGLLFAQAAAADFSASDLAGTWYGHALTTGLETGWEYSTLTIDSNGSASFASTDSEGDNDSDQVMVAISDEGVITVAEVAGIEGIMTMDKNLMVLTETPGQGEFMLNIFVKGGGGFAQSDLAGTWYGHSLASGAEPGWQRSTLVLDESGNATFSSLDSEGGQQNNEQPGVLNLSAEGIITPADGSALHGVMSPDKNILVATETAGAGTYFLHVFIRGGGAFSQSDLAGTWAEHALYTGAYQSWERATITIDAEGDFTAQWRDAFGESDTDSGNVSLSSSGIATVSDAPDFHGVMDRDKSVLAYTNTEESGVYNLSVAVRTAEADTNGDQTGDDDDDDDDGGGDSGCFIKAAAE